MLQVCLRPDSGVACVRQEGVKPNNGTYTVTGTPAVHARGEEEPARDFFCRNGAGGNYKKVTTFSSSELHA
jgi:hypothetical protein